MSWSDAIVEQIARTQHGLVTRRQLLDAGVHESWLYRRVAAGRLRRIHRAVYLVGPLEVPRAREMAAILACGPGSVIGRRTAAGMWRLLPACSPTDPVHVAIKERDVRRGGSIRTYRVQVLLDSEVTRLDGIPVTTPERTIVDLAGGSGPRELEKVTARAEREGLVERERLVEVALRHRRARGVPTLLALLRAGHEPAFTRSEAEETFLTLVRGSGLPHPKVNRRVFGFEVDFLWERERLVIEVDGYQFHRSRASHENDRHRDAVLVRAGYRVVRVTWRQLTEKRDATLVLLAQILARADR